jgi:hypothetical protein
LERNGSPKPIFETDPERLSFCTTLLIHPEFLCQNDQRVKYFQGIYRTGDQRTEKKADDYSRRACQKWQMDCIEIKGRGFKILEKRHDHDVKDCAFFHELI